MKKLILATSVIAALALTACGDNKTSEITATQYIPADTLYYAGTEKPLNLSEQILMNGTSASMLTDEDVNEFLTDLDVPEKSSQFLSAFISNLSAALKDEKSAKEFGIGEEISSFTYLVGLSAVFKISIEDPDKLWAQLDKAEKNSGITHEMKKNNDVDYRLYKIVDRTNLLVTIHDGYASFVVSAEDSPVEDINVALSAKEASASIAKSAYYTQIAESNPDSDVIAYFNTMEFAKGLTTKEDNRMASALTALMMAAPKASVNQSFDKLRSPVCSTEIQGIASNWPGISMASKINSSGDNIKVNTSTLLTMNNSVINKALQQIQGTIPSIAQDQNSSFSAGIGLNVSQLVPSLFTIISDLKAPTYQCAPLAEMQATAVKEMNPQMLSMTTGFVAGLKGVGFAAYDFDIDANNQPTFDTIFTIVDENPAASLASLSIFAPELNTLNLTDGGKPVEINQVISASANIAPIFANIDGKHLNIYSGEQATKAATNVKSDTPASNSFFRMHLNAEKIEVHMHDMEEMMDMEDMEHMAEALVNIDTMDSTISVDDSGIVYTQQVVYKK